MEEDYYSINAILADNHKLTCSFALDVEGLGYLEGSSEPDIKQHAKAELPFWLAQTLSVRWDYLATKQWFHHVSNPSTLFPPGAVRFERIGAVCQVIKSGWSGLAKRLNLVNFKLSLDDDQRKELLNTLLKAFTYRLPLLQDLAAHFASASTSDADAAISGSSGSGSAGEGFKDGMEAEERELFAIGQDAGRRIKQWYDTPTGRHRALLGR